MHSKAQNWEALPEMISDEVLHRFAVIGTHDEIGPKLLERYRRVVTDVEFSIAVENDGDKERLRTIAADIRADDGAEARRTILG